VIQTGFVRSRLWLCTAELWGLVACPLASIRSSEMLAMVGRTAIWAFEQKADTAPRQLCDSSQSVEMRIALMVDFLAVGVGAAILPKGGW